MLTDPSSRSPRHRVPGLGLLALLAAIGGCSADGELEPGPGPGGACAPGWSLCEGACVDLQGDGAHCGGCGQACGADALCSLGACVSVCGAGQSLCGSSCVELATDTSNCGACGAACTVGQSCTNGSCACVPGLTLCGSSCVDINSDGEHCGGCELACVGSVCASGSCRESCLPGQTQCGSSCVNLNTDLLNCGACEASCGLGQSCVEASCGCPSGLVSCDALCVDLGRSGDHCGGCHQPCATGELCADGQCVSSCPVAGQTACGSSCVTLASDPAHCGDCWATCDSGQSCVEGLCTDPSGTGGTGGTGGVSTGGTGGSATDTGIRIGDTCFPLCSSASVDPDGDGWGWENSTSCIVVDSTPYQQGTPCGSGAGGMGGAGGTTGGSGGTGGTTGGSGGTGGTTGGTGGTTGGSGGSASCSGGSTRPGFYVSSGRLYDNRCNEFVMRGVNYPYAWFATRNTQQDFQAIANTGANAVRVVLATGGRWNRVTGPTLTSIINAAKSNRLIAVLEVHDTTGWSEQSGSVDLANATTYWTSQDVRSALNGQEAYVIVNIGNEPMGNNTTSSWASRHVTAIAALRNAGLAHTLMVDAPNWGQDWTNTMRDGSDTTQIWNADPDRNLVFSVHMYDVYGTAQAVTSYFTNFLGRSPAMPLVVGEFAADHGASGNVDEDTILRLSQVNRVGYLGWSWSGNSSDLSSLDITNSFNASSLTTWGNRLINGTDGVRSTSSACTCFD